MRLPGRAGRRGRGRADRDRPRRGRRGRAPRAHAPAASADADAVVFGHSHIPLHEQDFDGGFQIFNPGSPTERRRSPRHTMGMCRAERGELRFDLVDLGA